MTPISLPIASSPSSPSNDWFTAGTDDQQVVMLICPPFQLLSLSSLATAHLGTVLRAEAMQCEEVYLHFDLAGFIGHDRYRELTSDQDGLLGESLFAESLHGSLADTHTLERLDAILGPLEARRAALHRLEQHLAKRLEHCRPQIVGLTTSFHQLVPALWCAKVIKHACPQATVVLGGAACSAPMGPRILEVYPQVDLVVSGSGEQPLLALANGRMPPSRFIESFAPVDLESLPIPSYEAFESAAAAAKVPELALAFESSRGCWWGQKNHCTFCGLNGQQMRFVAKSSSRVVREIRTLWERHERSLLATDAILAREHLREAMPELARFDQKPVLFYEIKANLRQADVDLLRDANVMSVQPGLESLSTPLLALLRKGTTALQNLAVLKWCRERGIVVSWNLLCAIPGERLEHYISQLALMKKIPHLAPPDCINPVRIDRHSPYFDRFGEFGWSRIQPRREYRYLHPGLDEQALHDLAYHFDGIGGASPQMYLGHLESALELWKTRHERGDGLYLELERGLVRNAANKGTNITAGLSLARVIERTHEITTISDVMKYAGCDRKPLDHLAKHDIVHIEGNKILNLAVRTYLARQEGAEAHRR